MVNIKDALRDMISIPAPSGYETPMTKDLSEKIKPFVDQLEIDNVGNLIAKIKGTDNNALKLMVSAHVDQLGLIIRKIDDNGFIFFERLGGIPEKILPGRIFNIITEKNDIIKGVCGIKSHHITLPKEKYEASKYLDLYIDVGVSSKKDVEDLGIEVGNPIVYEPHFCLLNTKRISGTTLDNRAGCAVLAKVCELLSTKRPKNDTYIVGTVKEEFNIRGAIAAARKIKPDISFSIDGFVTGDTPDSLNRTSVSLGKGPVLSMYNFHGRGTLNGLIPSEELVKLVKKTAKTNKIPLQLGAVIGIITESSYIQLEEYGIKCVDLAFPLRYSHSPIEMCDFGDLENLSKLIAYSIKDTVMQS